MTSTNGGMLDELPCEGPARAAWGLAAAVDGLRSIWGPNPDHFICAEGSLRAAGEMLLEYPTYDAAKQHGELALEYARQSARLCIETVKSCRQSTRREVGNEQREHVTSICQRHLQLSCDIEALLLDVAMSVQCSVPAYSSIDWQLRRMQESQGEEARICTPAVPQVNASQSEHPGRMIFSYAEEGGSKGTESAQDDRGAAASAATEGRTVGRAEVLALLDLLRDDSPAGEIHIRDCLEAQYACNGKTAGAVIVRNKWTGRIHAFVKPSNDYNHPYSQLAGSSFLAAVPLPPSIKLLTAYSTVCPATRPEARILRQLIADMKTSWAFMGDDGLGESRNKRLIAQLLKDGTMLQLVGPVPYAQDLSILLGGPEPKIKRERMAATLAAEFGVLIVLDLLSGTFVDRVQLGSPAWKHNRGNAMAMQCPGDNDEQVSLVAIDTDLFWDRVGQSVTEPASNPTRAKLQEKAEKTLASLRNWDSRGAGMALQAMKDVFALEAPATDNAADAAAHDAEDENNGTDKDDAAPPPTLGKHQADDGKIETDLKRGVEMAVASLHCPAGSLSDNHADVIKMWLADVDDDGSWPEHLRAPYMPDIDKCVIGQQVVMLSLAAQTVSPRLQGEADGRE